MVGKRKHRKPRDGTMAKQAEIDTDKIDTPRAWTIKMQGDGYEICDGDGLLVAKASSRDIAASHHAFALQQLRCLEMQLNELKQAANRERGLYMPNPKVIFCEPETKGQ